MILVKSSFEILMINDTGLATIDPLHLIELAGRTCYKSDNREMTKDSAKKFIKKIIDRGHESVIEHSAMTVKFICDRGVTHELVRHRLASFSQESTRYVNYKGGCTFVIPPWLNLHPTEAAPSWYSYTPESPRDARNVWYTAMGNAEMEYLELVNRRGWSPQQARSVLPNSTKTEIVMTANFREWRHVFKLRCSQAAHPQMREIMIPLLEKCKEIIPVIFDDIEY